MHGTLTAHPLAAQLQAICRSNQHSQDGNEHELGTTDDLATSADDESDNDEYRRVDDSEWVTADPESEFDSPAKACAADNDGEEDSTNMNESEEYLLRVASMYRQRRQALLSGRHPVTKQEAVRLAGLQLMIEFGEFVRPGTFGLGMILPPDYIFAKDVEALAFTEHAKCHGMSDAAAREAFVRESRASPTYGAIIFPVKEKIRGRMKTVDRILGLSPRAVLCLDPKTKELIASYSLTSIRKWTAQPANQPSKGGLLTLFLGDGNSDMTQLRFETTHGVGISKMVSVLVWALTKEARKKGIKVNTTQLDASIIKGTGSSNIRRRHTESKVRAATNSAAPRRRRSVAEFKQHVQSQNATNRWSWPLEASRTQQSDVAGSTHNMRPASMHATTWDDAVIGTSNGVTYTQTKPSLPKDTYCTSAMWSMVDTVPPQTSTSPPTCIGRGASPVYATPVNSCSTKDAVIEDSEASYIVLRPESIKQRRWAGGSVGQIHDRRQAEGQQAELSSQWSSFSAEKRLGPTGV